MEKRSNDAASRPNKVRENGVTQLAVIRYDYLGRRNALMSGDNSLMNHATVYDYDDISRLKLLSHNLGAGRPAALIDVRW